MGILVSWINASLWPNDYTQLTSESDDSSTSSSSEQEVLPPPPAEEQPPVHQLVLPSMPVRDPLPPSMPIATPAVASIYSSMMPVTSYFDDRHIRASSSEFSEPSTPRMSPVSLTPTNSSPPVPAAGSAVQVNIPSGGAVPGLDRETDAIMHDVQVPANLYSNTDGYAEASYAAGDFSGEDVGTSDLCFEDDASLSALERIYLFSRSSASFHRVFIARSLLQFLPEVAPSEAVEYVIPLMNGLAMDEDEAVKEALVEDLVSTIWWFLTHCLVVDQASYVGEQDATLLDVQAFTPLLGTLLLNPSTSVGAPARMCVVTLLMRIRSADQKGGDSDYFGPKERKLFERELIQQIVIGMAHLEVPGDVNSADYAGQMKSEATRVHPHETLLSSSPPEGLDMSGAMSPPAAVAGDEVVIATLASPSLVTSQIVEKEEREPSEIAALAASIPRPPSPIPSSPHMQPLPLNDFEPEDIQQPQPQQAQFVNEPMPLSATAAQWYSTSTAVTEHDIREESNSEQSLAPGRRGSITGTISPNVSGNGVEAGDNFSDFNEEQAAIGRLASMSLMAAVTASDIRANVNPVKVPLDEDSQRAFVAEIKRARHDPVYWVRREATFALGALAKVIPEELVSLTLVPLFESFTTDTIWNVRQSVLFSLPAILSRLPTNLRRTQALRTIMRLNNDQTPQVRTGVLEILGEVIYSFNNVEGGPPIEIVRLFIGEEGRDWHAPNSPALEAYETIQTSNPWATILLRTRSLNNSADPFGRSSGAATPALSMPNSNPARPLVCAFNLPAVALTLGRKRWPELRGLYLFLARTGATKVRQTLAASIGEVAQIIGPEYAREDLMQRWWDFVRGPDGAVRLKALEALEVLLAALGASDRLRIATSLTDIWDNNLKGWREREVLTKSLVRLVALLIDSGDVLRALLGRALRDTTAAVRKAAVDAHPRVSQIVSTHPDILRSVTDEVNSLAYDQSFRKRLTYVECVRSVLSASPDLCQIMDDSFWRPIVLLVSDNIVDVRIGAARLVSTASDYLILKQGALPVIAQELLRQIAQDPCKDVRAFVSHLLDGEYFLPVEKEVGSASVSAVFSRPPKVQPKLSDGLKEMHILERKVSPATPTHAEAG